MRVTRTPPTRSSPKPYKASRQNPTHTRVRRAENQNRAWRFWFPRGTRLDNLDQTHVDEVAAIINGQRRRNLGYQRPTDLYAAATVH